MKMTAFIYRSILNWLSLMADHEFLCPTLKIDQNFRKLLETNTISSALDSTESINHFSYILKE